MAEKVEDNEGEEFLPPGPGGDSTPTVEGASTPGTGDPDTPVDSGADDVDLEGQLAGILEDEGAPVPSEFNTDVSQLDDEGLVDFATQSPQALRGQAMSQSNLDRRRQGLDDREAELNRREEQSVSQPTPAMPGQVGVPDTPYVRQDPSKAEDPAEAFRISEANVAAQMRVENASALADIQQEQQTIRNQQVMNQVNMSFQELETKVSLTTVMRNRVWEHMQKLGTSDAAIAFLDLKKDGLLKMLGTASAARDKRAGVPPAAGATRSSTAATPPTTEGMSLSEKRKAASELVSELGEDAWDTPEGASLPPGPGGG